SPERRAFAASTLRCAEVSSTSRHAPAGVGAAAPAASGNTPPAASALSRVRLFMTSIVRAGSANAAAGERVGRPLALGERLGVAQAAGPGGEARPRAEPAQQGGAGQARG